MWVSYPRGCVVVVVANSILPNESLIDESGGRGLEVVGGGAISEGGVSLVPAAVYSAEHLFIPFIHSSSFFSSSGPQWAESPTEPPAARTGPVTFDL